MKKVKICCSLLFFTMLCCGQQALLVENKKINWREYGQLYKDEKKEIPLDKYSHIQQVEMSEITYLSDGLKIKAFMAVPKEKGKYPVIIYNRGGNRDFAALQLFPGKWKYPVALNFGRWAEKGYMVIGCNYRGSGGSEGMEEFGGEDVNDVLNLIKLLGELPKADTTRIGMFGWSRGGMMTYLTLKNTHRIKAAVVGGGCSDLTVIARPEMEKGVYAELIPSYWTNKEKELKKRSALFWVSQFPQGVPILLLHGNADWRVKSENSLRLALEFEKYRIPYRLVIFEGGSHGIREHAEEKEQQVFSWFERFLKHGEALPNMHYHGR